MSCTSFFTCSHLRWLLDEIPRVSLLGKPPLSLEKVYAGECKFQEELSPKRGLPWGGWRRLHVPAEMALAVSQVFERAPPPTLSLLVPPVACPLACILPLSPCHYTASPRMLAPIPWLPGTSRDER